MTNDDTQRGGVVWDLVDGPATAEDSVPWRERPMLTLTTAGELLGCSRGKLYQLAADGELTIFMHTRIGRTAVRTSEVLRLLDAMAPRPRPKGRGPRRKSPK